MTIGPWLGNNTSGNVISGPFTWVIAANTTVTVAGPGVGVPPATNVTVEQNAAVPSLEILAVKEFLEPRGSVTGAIRNRRREAQVYPNDETWRIEAKNLKFKNDIRPNEIKANVHSLVSDQREPVTLTWDQSTKSFRNNFPLPPSLFVPKISRSTSYSVVQKYALPNSKTGQKPDAGVIFGKTVYEVFGLALGTLFEEYNTMSPEEVTALDKADVAESSLRNYLYYGFEGVETTLTGVGLEQEPTFKALVKVAHPAEVLIADMHGKHNGLLAAVESGAAFNGVPRDYVDPNAAEFKTSAVTKKFFSLSCEAFDLHDYNNLFSEKHYKAPESHLESVGIAGRHFGGEVWYGKYAGRAVLLGYNGPAPTQVLTSVAPRYKAEVDHGASDILAWMRANRETAKSSADPKYRAWLCLNACAYDTNGDYYYLAYNTPSGDYSDLPPIMAPGEITTLGIYKVIKARWGLEATDWSKVPQVNPAGTEQDPYLGQKVE